MQMRPGPGKRIHYMLDGTGRDHYIYQNHGGFVASNSDKFGYKE